jgi:hypothetical protein
METPEFTVNQFLDAGFTRIDLGEDPTYIFDEYERDGITVTLSNGWAELQRTYELGTKTAAFIRESYLKGKTIHGYKQSIEATLELVRLERVYLEVGPFMAEYVGEYEKWDAARDEAFNYANSTG